MTRFRLLVCAAALVCGSMTSAQTVTPITSYNLRIYPAASTTVRSTTAVAAAAVTCDLPQEAATSNVNPNRVYFDDPVRAGRRCFWEDASATGPIRGVPDGSYEGTLQAVNSAGPGPESARSPFSVMRPVVPAELLGIRFGS